jgi:hypothetical protein
MTHHPHVSSDNRTTKDKRKSVGASLITEQQSIARRQSLQRYALIGGVGLGIVGLIATLAIIKPKATVLPGTEYPILGRNHIAVGSLKPQYNSNPPSSGDHYAEPAPWGVSLVPVPDERAIHNLEHGGLWITYKDTADQKLVEQLTNFTKRYQTKVVLSPRPDNQAKVAIASWGWVQTFDVVDERALADFINAHKDKGPEYVPDMGI